MKNLTLRFNGSKQFHQTGKGSIDNSLIIKIRINQEKNESQNLAAKKFGFATKH